MKISSLPFSFGRGGSVDAGASGRLWHGAGRRPDDPAVMEALEARQLMAAVAWDGGGDGLNWHDARNWSADVLPAAADDVTIGAEWSKVRVGIDAGSVEIRSLSTAARLEVPDGRLSATGTIRAERGVELGKVGNLEAGDRIEILGQPGGTMRLEGRLRAPSVRVDAGLSGYVLIGGSIDSSSASESGGSIVVLGERIALTGATLDASGRTSGGSIEVGGSRFGRGPLPNSVQLFTDAETSLRADAVQNGDGGQVVIYASDFTAFYGSASVRGGSISGNGGFVETSGGVSFDVNPTGIDAAAPKGASGLWVLDPTDVTINASGTGNATFNTGTGAFAFVGTPTSAILSSASVTTALAAGTSVTVFTRNPGAAGAGNISVGAAINPAIAAGAPTLTLRAANSITITSPISSTGAGSLSLVLQANNGTGPLGNEPPDDPNTAAGDVTLNAAITLPNGGVLTASGVNFSQILAGSVSAAGSINLNFSGNVPLASSLTSSGGEISIIAGNDGTGNITATLVLSLSAPVITLQAGDGPGGTNTAVFSTTNMTFRGGAGGATSPATLSLRQDAAVTDGQIPTTGQFGGSSISGMNYGVQSEAGSVQATNPAKFTGSNLVLKGRVAGIQLAGSYSLAAFTANGPVSLQGNTTVSTGGGGILFDSSITGVSGQSLTLNSTGATRVLGQVGSPSPLGGFTSDAGGSLEVASIATGGPIALLDSTVTLNGTYTTSDFNFTSNSANPQLTLLAGDVTVAAGLGQVRFNSEVQSTGGAARALTVTSGAFTVFGGSVGGVGGAADSQRIQSLSVSGPVTFGNGGVSDERFVRTASAGTAIDIVNNATLADNVTFDTGVGNPGAVASFNGTIGQNAVGAPFRNLTLLSQGTVNLVGSAGVGGNGTIGNIASDVGGTLNISGSVATTGTQTYADGLVRLINNGTFTTNGSALTLGNTLLVGNPVFNSNTGPILFNGTLDGAQNLNLSNNGSVTFVGNVGATTALLSLTIGPVAGGIAAIFQNSSLTTNGAIALNRPAIIQASSTTLTAAAGNFSTISTINGSVAGTNTLTVTVFAGSTAFFQSIGGATALSNLNLNGTGTANFAQNVTVVNNITAQVQVQFADVTFTALNGSMQFNGSIAGSSNSNPNNGTFTAGSTVTFGGLLGSGTGFAVSNITINALTTLLGGNVFYTGDMTVNGAVVLSNSLTVTANAPTSDLFVTGSVDSFGGGPRDLSLFIGGITRLSGGAGSVNALGAVSSATPGISQLSGNFNVGSWSIQEAVVLIGNTTINASGTVFITGIIDGAFNLTVNNSSTTTLNNTVGGTTPLATLTTGGVGGVSLNTITTTGNITIGNAVYVRNNITATAASANIVFSSVVALGGNVIMTSGTAGSITFNNSVNGDTADTRSLTLIAGLQVISFNGPIGNTQRLVNLTTQSTSTSLFNSISTQNAINIQAPEIYLFGPSYNTALGTINFNGPVDVRADVVVVAPTINFQSTLISSTTQPFGRSLTVGDGGSTTLFAGGVGGGARPFGSLTVNGLARFATTSVTTSNAGGASGAQTYTGTVQLENGFNTSNFTGTVVSFTDVTGLGGISSRGDLSAVGAVQLNGNIGSAVLPLRSVFLAGASITSNSASAIFVSNANGGTGNATFNTQTLINAPLTVNTTGGTGTFASLEGPSTFTLNGPGTFNDNFGFFTPLGTVTLNGAATLNVPEARVAGATNFNGAVTLVRATGTTWISTGNAAINFNSTVDAGGPGGGLALNTTGPVSFAGAVGATVPLNSITSNAGGSLVISGSVRTIGAQTYNDSTISIAEPLTTTNAPISFAGAATLNNGVAPDLTISSGSGDISFGSTINGARRLFLSSSGLTSVLGAVGSVARPIVFVTDAPGTSSFRDLRVFGSISINDPTTLSGVVDGSSSSIFFGAPITLAGNSSINNSNATNFTNLGDLINGAFSLDITSASPLSLTASIGATTPLAALTVNSPFPFGGSTITTTGNITLNGAMQLINNTTITAGGILTANNNIDSFDMQRSLTIAASGGANLQAVGNSTPLTTLTFTSATSAVVASGDIRVGTLVQQAGTGVYQASISTTAAGGISLTGTSFAISGGATTTNNGTFTLTNSGASSIGAGILNLDGAFAQSGGGVVTLSGVTITTTNDNVSFANAVTLAIGASSINTGAGAGNISFVGTIDGAQNLSLSSGSGGVVTLSGAVGAATRVGPVGVTGSGSFSAGSISAASLSRTLGGTTTIADINSNSPSGVFISGTTVTIGSVTTSNGGPLTIVASQRATFSPGAVINLDGALSQTGAGFVELNGNTISTTNDDVSFAGDVRLLNSNAVLSTGTGNITFAARLDGPNGVTLNSTGEVTLIGQAGFLNQLSSLTTNGGGSISLRDVRSGGNVVLLDAAATLNGAITIMGGTANLNIAGATTLAGNTSIQSNGGTVTFNSGLNADSAANNRTLTITGGSGSVQFLSPVGNSAALGGITMSGSGPLSLRSVTTTGDQSWGGSSTSLAGNVAATSGNVTFNSPVTLTGQAILSASLTTLNGGVNAGPHALIFRSADVAFNGNVSGTGALRIEPLAANQGITLGGPGGTAAVDLSSATLDRIQPGFAAVTFGRGDGSGVFTFSSPLQVTNPTTFLAPQPGGQFVVNAPITGVGNGSVTFTGSGSTILLGANIITAGQPIVFNDAIEVVAPNILIDSTANNTVPNGAPITFNFEVRELTGLPQTLTVRASTTGSTGNININHSFGTSLARFGVLTFITSPNADTVFTFIDGPRNLASNTLVITSRIKMNGEYLFLADAVTINGPIDNGGSLTVAAPVATFNGPIGATTPLGGFAGFGNHRLNGGIVRATGPVSFGPVVLGADTTITSLTSTAVLGDITGNGRALTLNAAGNITLTSAADVASLVTAGGGGTFIFGNIFTTGNQTYGDAVQIAATPITLASSAGTIRFNSTLSCGANDLTISANEIDFAGFVTGSGHLVLQPFNAAQPISVAGPEGGEPLDVTQSELDLIEPGFADLTIGRLDGTSVLDIGDATFDNNTNLFMAGPRGTINAGGQARGTSNASITVRGSGSTTNITGGFVTSGGAISIFDAVNIIGTNVRIDTTNNGTMTGGAVLIDRVINSAPALANNLRVDSGTGAVTLNGSVGTAPQGQLGSLIINGTGPANLNAPQIRTIGSQSYSNPVNLGVGVTLTNTNAPITFGSSINGANNLTIAPGTGSTVFNGPIGNAANPTNLTINSGNSRAFNAEVAVRTLTVFGGTVEFNGPASAQSGVFISGVFRGDGDVTVDGPLTWVGGSMTGTGRTIIGPDGTLIVSGGSKTLGRTIENFGVAFWTDGSVNFASGTIINRATGSFFAQSDGALIGVSGTNSLVNEGYLERSGSANAVSFNNIQVTNTGTLAIVEGSVSITPNGSTFTNAGILDLRVGRTLNIVGNFTNDSVGTIRSQFAALAPGQAGQVVATGNVILGGTLAGVQAGPITANTGDRVDVVVGASVSGTFSSVVLPGTGVDRRKLAATYLPDRAQILFTFSSDYNLDGELNQEDLSGFITGFLQEPSDILADFNGDGFVDQEDLTGFITDYFTDAG